MTIHDALTATSNHHGNGGGTHPFVDSAVRGAGNGAGRDSEHLIFTQIEHLLGPGLLIALILIVAATLWYRTKNRTNTKTSAATGTDR